MNLTNEFQSIRDWAEERGIFANGNPTTQLCKTMEELGELAKATIEQDKEMIKDGIGDVVVTLTNCAELNGLKIEDCINAAYQEIKNRKGKNVNGTFIREKNI